MCIAAFAWQAHPLHPFILLLNRDEYHDRATKPLGWWDGNEILGGRDEVAGGTWLACSRKGKVAFVTNVLELHTLSEAKSRGELPVRFLKASCLAPQLHSSLPPVNYLKMWPLQIITSEQFRRFLQFSEHKNVAVVFTFLVNLQSSQTPREFAEMLQKEAHEYNGFNLIVADIPTKSMIYITNRPKGDGIRIQEVPPGLHVLSNAKLDSPWPKAERLCLKFKKMINRYGESEIPVKDMIDNLMRDTTKADESRLPRICSLEWESSLSPIFVKVETPLGFYGTMSTAVLTVSKDGEVNFYETYLEKETWKEQTIKYHIEKQKQIKFIL